MGREDHRLNEQDSIPIAPGWILPKLGLGLSSRDSGPEFV